MAWPGAEPFAMQAPAPIEVEIVSPDELKASSKAPAQPEVDLPEVTASARSEAKSEPKSETKSEPKPVQQQAQNQAQQAGQPRAPNAPSAPQAAPPAQQAAQQAAPPTQQAAPSSPQAAPSYPRGGWVEAALSMPPTAASAFDVAESAANLAKDEILAFKAHLQKCWTPPARSSAEVRNLVVVLRVSFQPSGALAGEPSLLAASASPDGPALIQAATRALHDCQPYGFLPPAKYKEWRTLDLSFSPTGLSALPTL